MCSKDFSGGIIFGRAYFRRDLLLEGILGFKFGLDNKNSLKHEDNSLKQFKTANRITPWAYIREGLLSEGYLCLRLGGGGGGGGGLAYFREGL